MLITKIKHWIGFAVQICSYLKRDDERISDQHHTAAVDVLFSDLEQSSEYTMRRELVSPALIRALRLVVDHNQQCTKETKVCLICDKVVSGSSGLGPVAYK